ncbi:unnamed protein product [Rodentolepis nana]|uniref:Outer membrane protein n=1 Tax=Rodentolepis nana TaxID=102285 RepID=A0A0R3TBR9_RODNA|nr:unnamed protein product [Rodentolepis nana]
MGYMDRVKSSIPMIYRFSPVVGEATSIYWYRMGTKGDDSLSYPIQLTPYRLNTYVWTGNSVYKLTSLRLRTILIMGT